MTLNPKPTGRRPEVHDLGDGALGHLPDTAGHLAVGGACAAVAAVVAEVAVDVLNPKP